MVANIDEFGLSSGEAVPQREEPLGSVNGKPETDDKENNNGTNTDETQAVRYDYRKDDVHETFTPGFVVLSFLKILPCPAVNYFSKNKTIYLWPVF